MRVEDTVRIERSDLAWPGRLDRLGSDAPPHLDLCGNTDLLHDSSVALFCSVRAPGRVVVESYDVAQQLAATGGTVVGGFQSPLEREALSYLLAGCGGVIICPARRLTRRALPRPWRSAFESGRLLVVSPFAEKVRRPTSAAATFRNRLAAALASRVLILHATPGGRLTRLGAEVASWGLPLHCLDHPRNEDLRLLGGIPLPSVSPFQQVPDHAS